MGPVSPSSCGQTMAWAAPLTSRARWVRVYRSDASHPLDTIKTCMQGDIERATHTTTTASKILQDGGSRILLPRLGI